MRFPIFASMSVIAIAGGAVGSIAAVSLAANSAGAAAPATYAAASADEGPFLAENNVALSKMMAGMSVKPTGDVDTDFATMMMAHHQGAVDMALAELRYGKNEQLRQIAQAIVVAQPKEIAAMRHALTQQPLPTGAAPPPADSQSPTTPMPTEQGKLR